MTKMIVSIIFIVLAAIFAVCAAYMEKPDSCEELS